MLTGNMHFLGITILCNNLLKVVPVSLEFSMTKLINLFIGILLYDIIFLFFSCSNVHFKMVVGNSNFSYSIILQYRTKEIAIFLEVFRCWYRLFVGTCLKKLFIFFL